MPNVKDKMTGKTIAKMSYDNKGMAAANKMAADNPGYMVTDGSMRNETMYEGGGKTGMSMIGMPQYRKGGKLMYGHGGKTHKSKYMGGGMTKAMKKYEEGGKTGTVVNKEEFDEKGKTIITKVMKVNTPKGIRMYEGIGKSRNHGTANALANAIINTKINKNPADSLSTEDYNKKYVEKKKPKKKKRGLFKRRKKMEKGTK